MPTFIPRINKTIKSFEISVYEVDASITDEQKKLEDYLINKIKKIKVFNELDDVASMINVPGITPEFYEKFKKDLVEMCNPSKHKIAAFDVRRSYITEFMSQLLLEKKYNCIFYDDADKRLNADAITINKHNPGIDVVGIKLDDATIKFAVCEVKASKSAIPCTESENLLADIEKAKDISTSRLSKEILKYISDLHKTTDDSVVGKIIQFLLEILSKKEDKGFVLSNVIFFPFLIRNNPDIVSNEDVTDFENFDGTKFTDTNIKGIIWSFNNDIDTFCTKIWDEAIAHV